MLRINNGSRALLRVCVRPVFYLFVKTMFAFVFALAGLFAGWMCDWWVHGAKLTLIEHATHAQNKTRCVERICFGLHPTPTHKKEICNHLARVFRSCARRRNKPAASSRAMMTTDAHSITSKMLFPERSISQFLISTSVSTTGTNPQR